MFCCFDLVVWAVDGGFTFWLISINFVFSGFLGWTAGVSVVQKSHKEGILSLSGESSVCIVWVTSSGRGVAVGSSHLHRFLSGGIGKLFPCCIFLNCFLLLLPMIIV